MTGKLELTSRVRFPGLFLLMILLLAIGCAHKEILSDDQAKASAQLQRWVPIGTSTKEAQQIMEQHGFSIDTNDVTSLHCSYEGPSKSMLVETIGLASFALKDGKVSAEQVKIYYKGP